MVMIIEATRENMLNAIGKLSEQGRVAFAVELGRVIPKYQCNNGDKCIIGHMMEGIYDKSLEGDSVIGLYQAGEVALSGDQPHHEVIKLLLKLQDLHDDAVTEYNSGAEAWEGLMGTMKNKVNEYFDNIGE